MSWDEAVEVLISATERKGRLSIQTCPHRAYSGGDSDERGCKFCSAGMTPGCGWELSTPPKAFHLQHKPSSLVLGC